MVDIIWAKVQVVLTNVPIEYMDCDSNAFIGGDEIIVEFIDQDWDQPKVIGFKENPKICNFVYIFPAYRQGERYNDSISRTMRLDYNSESWQWKAPFPQSYLWDLPIPLGSVSRVEYSATGEGGIGFTLGGRSVSDYTSAERFFDHLDLFDSETESFSIGNDHPQEKSSLIFESLNNGKCISHGGRTNDTVFPNTHRYLIAFNSWEVAQTGENVYDHASFMINGNLFIVGGATSQGHGKKSNAITKSYNNDYDVWSNHVTCPQENWLSVHGYSLEGKGLVGGGGMIYDPSNEVGLIGTINDTYLYDVLNYSWTKKANGYASFGNQATSTAVNKTVALQFSGGGAGSLTHWFDYKLSTDIWRDRGVFGLTVSEDPLWYSHRANAAGAEL